jgi:hypothetical protein
MSQQAASIRPAASLVTCGGLLGKDATGVAANDPLVHVEKYVNRMQGFATVRQALSL